MKLPSLFAHTQKLLTVCGDFIFPPSPAEKLLRKVTDPSLKTLYQPGMFKQNIYLCRYSDPITQAAVLENKFHHNQKAARILGDILKQWTSTQNNQTIFIPVPLGKQRFRQRGHNQVESILQTVIPETQTNTQLLRRRVETRPQSHLNKKSRLQNADNIFEYIKNPEVLSQYSQVIIVDDVVTTGATLNAARATLAPHLPPDITLRCLAIAH